MRRGRGGSRCWLRIIITAGDGTCGLQCRRGRRGRRQHSSGSSGSSTASTERIGTKPAASATDRTLEATDGSTAKDGRGRVSRCIRSDCGGGGSAEPQAHHRQSAYENEQQEEQADGTESQASTRKHTGRCVGSRPEGRGRGSATATYERRGHNAKGHVNANRRIIGRHDRLREADSLQQRLLVQNDDAKQTKTHESAVQRGTRIETQTANASKTRECARDTEQRQRRRQPENTEADGADDDMGRKQQQQQQPSTDESKANDTMGRQQQQQQPNTDRSSTATAAAAAPAAAATAAAAAAQANAASETAALGHRHIRESAAGAAMETRTQRRQEVETVKATQRRSQRWDNQAWRRDYDNYDAYDVGNYDEKYVKYDERYQYRIDRRDLNIIGIKELNSSGITVKDAVAKWTMADVEAKNPQKSANNDGKTQRFLHTQAEEARSKARQAQKCRDDKQRLDNEHEPAQNELNTGYAEVRCPWGNDKIKERSEAQKIDENENRNNGGSKDRHRWDGYWENSVVSTQHTENVESNGKHNKEGGEMQRGSKKPEDRKPQRGSWTEGYGDACDVRRETQRHEDKVDNNNEQSERRATHRNRDQGNRQEQDEMRMMHRHERQDERRETHRQQEQSTTRGTGRSRDVRCATQRQEEEADNGREQDERRETHRHERQDERRETHRQDEKSTTRGTGRSRDVRCATQRHQEKVDNARQDERRETHRHNDQNQSREAKKRQEEQRQEKQGSQERHLSKDEKYKAQGAKTNRHEDRPERQKRETWGHITKRVTSWADADEDSSEEEPQDEWQKASKAAMKGESDETLASLVNQKLRSTTNEGKARLLQQMRTWPQNVLLRLAASLQSDAWKQRHDFNDSGWQDT